MTWAMEPNWRLIAFRLIFTIQFRKHESQLEPVQFAV